MAKKIEAYVDTSAFVSFLDASDTHHRVFAGLFADPPRLLTSSLVIAEGHGWFLRRYDSAKALDFLNFIDSLPALSIQTIGAKELESGAIYLKKFKDQTLTLADAVGLSLMQSLKIKSCWSTDRHLGLTGVPLAIHRI